MVRLEHRQRAVRQRIVVRMCADEEHGFAGPFFYWRVGLLLDLLGKAKCRKRQHKQCKVRKQNAGRRDSSHGTSHKSAFAWGLIELFQPPRASSYPSAEREDFSGLRYTLAHVYTPLAVDYIAWSSMPRCHLRVRARWRSH